VRALARARRPRPPPPTAWHRKVRRRFSSLLFLQLAQCTQEGMNTSPTK